MPFKSWQSYWIFARKIKHANRYMHDGETIEFLDEVLKSCGPRVQTLPAGKILWRSQLGSDVRKTTDEDGNEIGEEPCPHPVERMSPRELIAVEGRVNPKGIPCLYLATTKETAMSECRPWLSSEVSVAQFKTKKDMKIVNCSVNVSLNPLYFDIENGIYEPDEKERERSVWAHIDRAFSRPVVSTDDEAHYAPTQVIAELFKSNGYDGIAYKSMLSDGYNLALFDLHAAGLVSCTLYEVKQLSYDFSQASSTYVIVG